MKTRFHRTLIMAVIVLFLLLFTAPASGLASPPPQSQFPSDNNLINKLKQETGGTVRISYHDETGQVRFIGVPPSRSIRQPAILGVGAGPEEAAEGFFKTYGKLFGLKNFNRELSLMKSRTLSDGRSFVRYQQVYEGVPVLGGELIVQSDRGQNIISANGEILPDIDLDTNPTISSSTARQAALEKIARVHQLNMTDLTASEPELWIYNPALLGGPGRRVDRLVWRLEVTPQELLPIRELVLVDANVGVVVLHINQIDMAKNRVIYDNQNNPTFDLPGNGPVRTEGGPDSGVVDVNLAYDYAGDTYDFFFDEHGRDSLDDAGLQLISTTRYCPDILNCPYANAFWNGTQMAYGDGFAAADDVVGHELTHGVTEFSSQLFYFYQSGAINESLSDVWGEFIDLTNGAGTDTPAVRWLVGEDIPSIGAIRSLADPPAFNDPDSITSKNYWCDEGDSGGVHTNSGVNNKAAYLMTDGDTFNGKTVTGLGISKVADLYYEVQTNMLTSGSNYNDLYDALIQASFNLGFDTLERESVQNALDAVEMNVRPCGEPPEAAFCPDGQFANSIFKDDLEDSTSGNWITLTDVGTNTWYYPQNDNPFSFDATYASSGQTNFWGYNQSSRADYSIAMNLDVALPPNAFLHFKHDWAFEDAGQLNAAGVLAYDGGVVEYSTTGGSSWTDAGSLFDENGYNGIIVSAFNNPLGGRSAFISEAHGYTASRVDLSSLAGQDIRFRFRIGTDNLVDSFGWFIDDIQIYTCTASSPTADKIFVPLITKN
ncbi:MAG: M4 family metallopeptidase [Anaerolineae bacterium]|nr:M4 family metallopeptidase [Anaerolineae bacterium]